jgi:hypothetical protein
MRLFAWPKQAAFNRVVPKSKIYEHAVVSSALKERFVQQVEQIKWAYKLAPETVNLPATEGVSEIQVFVITLKGDELDQAVLKAIDQAIPFPLIFEVMDGARVKMVAAYKRFAQSPKNNSDIGRWSLGSYFDTGWKPDTLLRERLPVALDMEALYEQLLIPLVRVRPSNVLVSGLEELPSISDSAMATYSPGSDLKPSARLTLEQRIKLAEDAAVQMKLIERLEGRLGREKQFNKRLAINTELRAAKQELQRLEKQQAAAESY